MFKITLLGAGSTVFAKNVIGDCILTPELGEFEVDLFDIDPVRLEDSKRMLENINRKYDGKAMIKASMDRKEALRNADYVINTIQVGGYDPCTITDFEVPKKYGLRQTIADTLGIGGIFRALRTIPVMQDFADDMEEVCPDAWFLNYVNPMCINHQAWLLEITDKDGNDLYPEIKKRSLEQMGQENMKWDLVRHEMMHRFGYYITESSEHTSEYVPWFIKEKYPELIERYNIPLDEYPRRCINQIKDWENMRDKLVEDTDLTHEKTHEFAAYIIQAMRTDVPYRIHGNVLNTGLITNLPQNACVEVPCLVDRNGVNPCYVGDLPEQCAAINRTNINVQLLTIEAARTLKKEYIYMAAMMDPHTSSELSMDDIRSMCDDLIEAHGSWLPKFK